MAGAGLGSTGVWFPHRHSHAQLRAPVFGQVPGQEWFDVGWCLAPGLGAALQVPVEPQPGIDLQVLALPMTAQMAMVMMSLSKCRLQRLIRGSFRRRRYFRIGSAEVAMILLREHEGTTPSRIVGLFT